MRHRLSSHAVLATDHLTPALPPATTTTRQMHINCSKQATNHHLSLLTHMQPTMFTARQANTHCHNQPSATAIPCASAQQQVQHPLPALFTTAPPLPG
jgi:hypothetical protein